MQVQIFAQKTKSSTTTRARSETYRVLDQRTETVLSDALKASRRARKLLNELRDI